MPAFRSMLPVAIVAVASLTADALANTVVPYEKHSTRIVAGMARIGPISIPFVYLEWDWEKGFNTIPWPPMQPMPTNPMSLLTGPNYTGDTFTWNYATNMPTMNELVLSDGTHEQRYTITSGSVTYHTGPLNGAGHASISMVGASLTATLTSADFFGVGNIATIQFEAPAPAGDVFLGAPNGAVVPTTMTTNLMGTTRLRFPNSSLPADRNGFVGTGDWSGEIALGRAVPAISTWGYAALTGTIGIAGVWLIRRRI